MQDAVNYIYEQFAKSGLDKIELDINTHDINLTINDLDKAEGHINNFMDYIKINMNKI